MLVLRAVLLAELLLLAEKEVSMSLKYSIFFPMGGLMDLTGIKDPVEAYETLTRMAHTADEYGYESIWVADHFHAIAQPTQEVTFECWTTAAALARDTKRVRIGQMVTGNSYRNPALQAKMASTLDVISHGRFTFGIGAGWYEPDYRAYGYEYPDGPERLRRLREAVQIIRAMWTQEETTFEGNYYQVHCAMNRPKGVQQPHIPMLIAGGGEQVTLKLVAQYGDICNVYGDPATVEHKFAVLKAHCEAVGRDYHSIHRTVQVGCRIANTDEQAQATIPDWAKSMGGDPRPFALIGSPETIRQRIAAYEAAGAQELTLIFDDMMQIDMARRFAREFINIAG